MLTSLIERFRRGDRLALSRLVSLVARGEHVEEVLAQLGPPAVPARVRPGEQRRPGSSYMEEAGRAGSESGSDHGEAFYAMPAAGPSPGRL